MKKTSTAVVHKLRREDKSNPRVMRSIAEILASAGDYPKLDIACGGNKQGPDWIGMDYQALPEVDVVHDIEMYPWPLPDESIFLAVGSHIAEHINPAKFGFINWMNEIWRVLKFDSRLMLSLPYGVSAGFVQDPTHCFAAGADVLCRSGFKPLVDVEEGEEILTLNPGDLSTEYGNVVGAISEAYKGPMVRFDNLSMDLCVTPNHDLFSGTNARNPNWRLGRADSMLELTGHHPRRAYAKVNFAGPKPDVISIPRVEQIRGTKCAVDFPAAAFMEFMGWYLSEGSLDRSGPPHGYTVSLAQSAHVNSAKCDRIRLCLDTLGMNHKQDAQAFTTASKSLYSYLLPLGRSADKYIPQTLKEMHPDLLRCMLSSLIDGDGRSNGTGHEYASVSKRLADDVQEVALKCGYRALLRVEEREPTTVICGKVVNQSEHLYIVGISCAQELYYPRAEAVDYDGRVECITVDRNHVILVRNNGRVCWSGNCNPCNENTWRYFDPLDESTFYKFYRPKPWKIIQCNWSHEGFMEVVLEKRRLDKSYEGKH